MDTDPTECYLEMYRAMRDGRLVEARRCAEELKMLLERGVAPPRYSDVELRAYLASVPSSMLIVKAHSVRLALERNSPVPSATALARK